MSEVKAKTLAEGLAEKYYPVRHIGFRDVLTDLPIEVPREDDLPYQRCLLAINEALERAAQEAATFDGGHKSGDGFSCFCNHSIAAKIRALKGTTC